MGMSKFHGIVDVHLNLCIRHMKRFIRDFCGPYETAGNSKFVHKKLSNPHIELSLSCHI